MTFNSITIIQEIRADFEQMLDFVMGEKARSAKADEIERGLFSMLLALGFQLLLLFFTTRSQACSRDTYKDDQGHELPYQQDKKRDYFSIFGKMSIWRPYFYQKGRGGKSPLDAELSLGEDIYSDMVREISEYLGVYTVYKKSSDILKRFLNLNLSTRALKKIVAKDASDVKDYYEQKNSPLPEEEAEILVIQADGKGIPIILERPAEKKVRLGKGEKRGRKKEAIVTTVYSIKKKVRSPEEVVGSYFEGKKVAKQPPKPKNKHVWATLDGKDAALSRLSKQVSVRQGDHIQYQVALSDGCEALQTRITDQFPDFVLILDFIHAEEYLWDVANRLLGEDNEERVKWVAEHTLKMLSGETDNIVQEFRQLAQKTETSEHQKEQLAKTANYFERNLPYMDYSTYLEKGWPIASGVIEGACRHFVKDRMELSGMRWTKPGAENLLGLRAIAENDDWDAYHAFRRKRRDLRLHGASSNNSQQLIETSIIKSHPQIINKPVTTISQNPDQLPLAV